MIDVLNDIETLEKSLDLDDFGRQMVIWNLIQKKKKEVADFEAEMCPQGYDIVDNKSNLYKIKETA